MSREGTASLWPIERGFLNQPVDGTELSNLSNRQYDPQAGIFSSVDPLVVQTGDPYLYGGGNPVTMSDPTGLCAGREGSSGGCGVDYSGSGVLDFVQAPAVPLLVPFAGAAAVAVATALITVGTVGLLGKDLPDLPGPLPNLPKFPSACWGPVTVGDCDSDFDRFVKAIVTAQQIFEGTAVDSAAVEAFALQLYDTENIDADGNVHFVADSNVFMARPGKPGDRAFFDALLTSPIVTLYVTESARNEIDFTDQFRLTGSVAKVIVGADPILPASFAPTGRFGRVDATVVQSGSDLALPVLTSNRAMTNQVRSNGAYKGFGWDTVSFVNPPG